MGFFKLNIDTVRLSGGAQYVLTPKVHLKCKVICLGANLRFAHQSNNAVSAVLNGQAVPPERDKVNGNQIGGSFLIGF